MIKLLDLIKELIPTTGLVEVIEPDEAYHDSSAIQTVVDGKRKLGTITLDSSKYRGNLEKFTSDMKALGLNILHVPSNPFKMYIYYRDGAKAEAEELRDIAEKYKGYFAWYATEEDTRRIGKLLSYSDEAVEKFVKTINQDTAKQERLKQGLE